MDHIRLFDTVEEFNSAYTGNEYVEPWVSYCVENSGVSFNKKENPLEKPLTFNIISGGSIYWKEYINDEEAQETDEYFREIEYNKNNAGWVTITDNTELSVAAGDTMQFRGNNNSYCYYDENEDAGYFTNFSESTAVFSVEGNIMSLIDSTGYTTATTIASSYTFYCLFRVCTGLTSAENLILPATTLTESCYGGMFYGCTSLTTVPELPATTLADYCYASMFSYCTSLTTVPSNYLPASIVGERSYNGMFADCTSLTTAPELPATALGISCYEYMFSNCTSLTTTPELPATTLTEQCYCGMFRVCTGLTTAPTLPATTLATNCYFEMFYGCTSLTSAPELPATTLATNCYFEMFYGCTSLNYIKCLATDISAGYCTTSWVNDVASTGTFVKNPNMSNWTTGNDGIPTNWTVQDAS